MAEEIKTAAPVVETKVDTKTADKPVVDAGKPAPIAKPAVDDKTAPIPEVKAEVKPAQELKSLLEEASEAEVKLDKDGKPIVAEAKVVPEKYEFKLPEGMTLDAAKLAIVEPLFKELGLDNVSAQKLVDLQLGIQKSDAEAHAKAWEVYKETQKQSSKDYFGAKLPEVMRNMARARDTFLPKDAAGKSVMQEKFEVAGFTNDKDFIEFMDRVGRVIGEGKFVEGKRSAPGKGEAGKTTEQAAQEGISVKDVYTSMAKT